MADWDRVAFSLQSSHGQVQQEVRAPHSDGLEEKKAPRAASYKPSGELYTYTAQATRACFSWNHVQIVRDHSSVGQNHGNRGLMNVREER